ncbi:DUF4190 domain-containing protein [Streptomyces sp. NPDC088812]|uniref:DUF4190 domain-containing protein n=1 Tax=Streptomyces sp. NPDC088812 TaxID=3365905 RepID=UPI0038008EC8
MDAGPQDVPAEVPQDVPAEVPPGARTEVPPGARTEVSPGAPAEVPQDARTEVPQDVPAEVSLGKGDGRTPSPSVHDRLTVTSLPAEPQPSGPPPNPFAVPQDAQAAAVVPPPPPNPFAVPQDGAVPPPPIAPDGPGQVPYGYPGHLGHPGPAAYGGAPGGYGGSPGGHAGSPAGYGGGPAAGYGGVPAGYGVPGGHGGVPGYYGWSAMRPMENGMGVAAMVLGIVAAGGFCMWPAAIVMGVLAVVFGAIGRGKANRGQASNGGQALAGIICGAAGVVLGIGMLVLLFVAP